MTVGEKLELAWVLAEALDDHVHGNRTKHDPAFLSATTINLTRLIRELRDEVDEDALSAEVPESAAQ